MTTPSNKALHADDRLAAEHQFVGRTEDVLITIDGLEISTDRSRLDVGLIHGFLSGSSYWAQGRPRAVVQRSIDNSLCFGAYLDGRQVGFGRVVTDYAVIGYVADVFVVPEVRGRSIGKALVKAMVEHPDVAELKVMLLRSTDSRSLYAQFGFEAIPKPDEMMGRYQTTPVPQAIAADDRVDRFAPSPVRR